MADKLFYEILRNTPKEERNFDRLSMCIALKISQVLEEKDMLQKELATLIKKNESEISKWLSGSHNFTLKTISKLEAILDEEIIEVQLKDKSKNDNMAQQTINIKSKSPSIVTISMHGKTHKVQEITNQEIYSATFTKEHKSTGILNVKQY